MPLPGGGTAVISGSDLDPWLNFKFPFKWNHWTHFAHEILVTEFTENKVESLTQGFNSLPTQTLVITLLKTKQGKNRL